jgi:hypothetical protein
MKSNHKRNHRNIHLGEKPERKEEALPERIRQWGTSANGGGKNRLVRSQRKLLLELQQNNGAHKPVSKFREE